MTDEGVVFCRCFSPSQGVTAVPPHPARRLATFPPKGEDFCALSFRNFPALDVVPLFFRMTHAEGLAGQHAAHDHALEQIALGKGRASEWRLI